MFNALRQAPFATAPGCESGDTKPNNQLIVPRFYPRLFCESVTR